MGFSLDRTNYSSPSTRLPTSNRLKSISESPRPIPLPYSPFEDALIRTPPLISGALQG
ncbi:uncharacterized protein LY79DRAFT_564478 [Colletotrichum navitas]|uniref:Uncharacterized protein n=1 Tax=Colletotrichum navitas TaxID=681940 RepID=A0AAD8UZI2_9PEZI|nr:uncharacterized protein LY79DRAFT_564478 [Colletotrichum navitas]KAK1579290.1 hypothetical protein LY79DRAFT_564478 [Colletotrichum navitas]